MLNKKMMNEILEKTGVLQTGHFLLTSGKHSNKYMQCAKIFQHPDISAEIDVDIYTNPYNESENTFEIEL